MSSSSTIVPVILCGGQGTRLWPLSRQSYPKQFAPLLGVESLFQKAALRLSGPGFAAPYLLTQDAYRFVVAAQMDQAGLPVEAGRIVIEPQPRGTAPAALAAALLVARSDPDALMLLAPSDHVIADPGAFEGALRQAANAAMDGAIVLFGVPPTRPETGYGYLELGPKTRAPARPLSGFREKPGADEAKVMAQSGKHLWNAGLFLCKARSLIAAFEAHAPDYLPPVAASVEKAAPDLGFLRLAAGAWDGLEDRSLDYAVMEKASGLAVVPLDAGWSDLGDWAAVGQHMAMDTNGVSTSGPVTALDCHDAVLRSENEALQLVGIGLRDVIAVAMDDAVLVADSSRAQEVREAVDALRAAGAQQADQLPRDYRPWGWYETLVSGDRFQVKRIVVEPGGELSLQSHLHRAEHWVVVAGTARVTIEDTETLVTENESIYVPLGARHRLGNPGKVPLTLIEVQTGRYLGEDDITRYDDIYARK